MSTTHSATFSAQAIAHEPAGAVAVRHLSADIARAHAEGDLSTARVLARALAALLGDESEGGDVIDLARERKKRT